MSSPLWFMNSLNRVPTIVLASASPNRLQLLQQIGIHPLVEVSTFAEDLPKTLTPGEYTEETATAKAKDVAERLLGQQRQFDVVIGCDTMILSPDGREIIGKPKDAADALNTLRRLNGQKHHVYTGVCLIDRHMQMDKFHKETAVKFENVSDSLLEAYAATGEPMGRAGSYAIQGKGAILVRSIEGCFSNVVGLPIHELTQKLHRILGA